MRIWGISDTHLAQELASSMGFYGPIWIKHKERIAENWHANIGSNDVVLIGGDTTWANSLKNALVDIHFLGRLPGKYKFIIRGNHDVWWRSFKDVQDAMPDSVHPLSGGAEKAMGHVFCGTMGWLSPNDPQSDNLDQNFFNKELNLLRESLESAIELNPTNGLHVLLHFPPFTSKGDKTPFFKMLKDYPVTTCSFGHFHAEKEWEFVPQGNIDGIDFRLIATDYLHHKPFLIWEG